MNLHFSTTGTLLIAWIALALANLSRAQSFTDTLQFPAAASRTDVNRLGSATIVGDYLQLTDSVASQEGSLVIASIPPGETVKRLTVKFEVQTPTAGSTTLPADGFSFNFGPDLFGSTIREEGVATGLAITFDTFDNGGSDTAPAAEVVYDSAVKAGISFSGLRAGGRAASYSLATDSSGNSMSLSTGDTPVPVQIDLAVPNAGGNAQVSVTWKGVQILQDVAVPYTPSKGWRIGFGGRTGGSYQKQSVRNISIEADTVVNLTVTSAVGGTQVYPAAGSSSISGGQSVTFTAPDYVYLDRYGKILTGTDDDMRQRAAYRAKRVGGTVNGQPLNTGSTVKLTEDSVVNWQWELEYLAEVNTGTESIQGLSASSVTDSANQPTLGRNFRPLNYNFNSVVYSQIMGTGAGLDIQFQPRGYVIENAPGAPERFLQLSGGGDHLRADSAGTGLTGDDGSFSIEFWARRDPQTMTADQNVVSLGSSTVSGGQLRAGFTASNAFFLSNNGITVTAPASLTDDSWHHWAAVNDKTANTVTLYRDGTVVAQGSTALNFSGNQVVTIGARANGASAEGFFPGGVNNVRVWKTALPVEQIRNLIPTVQVGPGNTALGLEMPFDTVPTATTSGVYLERRKGGPSPSSVADTSGFTVEDRSVVSGFSLPFTWVLPAATGPAGYYGWTLRSKLTIDTTANYKFKFYAVAGGQLRIDGGLMIDIPEGGLPTIVSCHLTSGQHTIQMDVFDNGALPRNASLSYSSTELGLSWVLLDSPTPATQSKLNLTGRDEIAAGAVPFNSSEGRNVSFLAKGFEAVLPETGTLAQVMAAACPGFHFKPLETTTGTFHNIDPADAGSLSSYRRVFWLWDKKFRFKVNVSGVGLPSAALSAVSKYPYFKTTGGGQDGNTAVAQLAAPGVYSVLDLWLTETERLEVGTVYRTPDRRYTLEDVTSAINNFSTISFRSLQNATYGGRAAKSSVIEAVTAPGSLTYNYDATLFRTQLAIGQGLDFSTKSAMNGQLVPDLPDDAQLVSVTANSQPAVTAPEAINDEPGWTGGEGDPWQWDVVGQKWYPLKPGTYTIAWKDRNTAETYTMEITVAFPDETQTLAFLEDAQGNYLGTAPDYETNYHFAATDASFPATPGAHYRYLAVSKSPIPVDLEPSGTDRWKFLRQAFSTQGTAKVDKNAAAGPRFTESSKDVRTVHVFSYRPTTGVGSGDLTREQIAVRVIHSLDSEANRNDDPAQTVASRITSPDDTAGYGSGYIVNEVSNYNASLYDRTAAVGKWGPVYPVNWSGLFTGDEKLSIGYYENPGSDPASLVNPPVGWPYIVTHYDDVDFPDSNAASTPVIYIASQLGSEGVNQDQNNLQPQRVFDPVKYTNLKVYNQPDRDLPGYNPNEEHALVAPSNLANMTGDQSKNIGQSAFFALQYKINRENTTVTTGSNRFTSKPFVLGQYTDATTGQTAMIAYEVVGSRVTVDSLPFPKRDPETHLLVDEEGNPVAQPENPTYDFKTVIFAGDIVAPFYPMNRVSGGGILEQSDGGNKEFDVKVTDTITNTVNQITLWHDKNEVPWVVAGDVEDYESKRVPGSFFYRFWYPLAQGFWLGEGTAAKGNGTPVCWLPQKTDATLSDFTDKSTKAQPIDYSSYWKENYPVLKRGETLAYAGGEYKADNPTAPGLPGVIGWASGEVVFDSATPDMAINDEEVTQFNARFMRLLDALSVDFTKEAMGAAGLTPANPDKVSVSGTRWYFKQLAGSLGRCFYYDSLQSKLVVRGRINDRETGDPKLTQPPVGLATLEPNVLDANDQTDLKSLADGNAEWAEAIKHLYELSNPEPHGLELAGPGENLLTFETPGGETVTTTTKYRSLQSLGTGASLVPNPESFPEAIGEEKYVTLVENNDPKTTGAVTLHVIRLGDERYRGAIAVVTPNDAFDEKVELKHSGDFGGQTENMYYQWWMHAVAPLDGLTTPDQSTTGWELYQQGKGLNSITFSGRPDVTLADKLFYVRYGHADELGAADSIANVDSGAVADTAWRLVSPDDNSPDWAPGSAAVKNSEGAVISPAHQTPYQWAGAANSPQLQASGAHRFLPQLLMGWVKRVLDAVNPYEARYSADFSGDSPATYSSMLIEAGRPYNGPVALNSAKDVIENVGLIELYETVLQRARDLTANQPSDAGINQALLLASTRLAMLYGLLGSEAYADAQNPSLSLGAGTSGTGSALATANPWAFAFMNEVPDLLQEELALLRGTDYLKSYPVYNRLFWNYFKGLGEAAYNINYNVGDKSGDGLIDENDAAVLYPMGHGDAWGHYLSSIKMHYGLLLQSNYDWQARAELYSLLGNVIPTDYLDENSFARTANSRARAGLSIVKATYRASYVADPAAQWQGYTDSADPARAWGVSEWAARSAQGAHFDWLMGNAILPATATTDSGQPAQGLDRIDRATTQSDLRALAGSLQEIQQTLEGVNQGLTPIGLHPDAISFGIDSFRDGLGWPQTTHFQTIYDRAIGAAANARQALDFVSSTSQNLRAIADDTGNLGLQGLKQDLDYRNRLITLLGTPYSGTIGAGKIYKEGYSGPDLLTYMYLDATTVEQITPLAETDDGLPDAFRNIRMNINDNFIGGQARGAFLDFNGTVGAISDNDLQTIYQNFYLTQNGGASGPDATDPYAPVILHGSGEGDPKDGNTMTVEIPISTVEQYAFTAPEDWGRRQTTGEVQDALNGMLKAEVDLEKAIDEYQVYLNKLQNLATYAQWRVTSLDYTQKSRQNYLGLISIASDAKTVLEALVKETDFTLTGVSETLKVADSAIPTNINLIGGAVPFVPAKVGFSSIKATATIPVAGFKSGTEIAAILVEGAKAQLELLKENDADIYSEFNELLELLKELSNELQEDPSKRLNMATAVQDMATAANQYRAKESEAQRLINERAADNRLLASSAQRDRYADMITRLTRDEALRKYENAMDNALRYAWLAAKAYDYETSLSPSHPAHVTTLLQDLMSVRQLGQWDGDTPMIGNGGLAEVLAKLKANYDHLNPQTGLNNPTFETSNLSLRTEAKRILPGGASSDSDEKWRSYLASAQIPDLNQDRDFTRYCRPFADPAGAAQPGFRIEFSTEINSGRNFFGNALSGADHAFSSASFSTKIRSVGVGLTGYDVASDGKQKLSGTPRVYLVPAGLDVLRYSDGAVPKTRAWNVVNQRIPAPFPINTSNLNSAAYTPSINGINGSFTDLVRLADLRAYPNNNGALTGVDPSSTDTQLFGRSAWNTRWVLFIPAATLGNDQSASMQRFIETVTDIQLQLSTWSNSGM
jgi:hypothetical protein